MHCDAKQYYGCAVSLSEASSQNAADADFTIRRQTSHVERSMTQNAARLPTP